MNEKDVLKFKIVAMTAVLIEICSDFLEIHNIEILRPRDACHQCINHSHLRIKINTRMFTLILRIFLYLSVKVQETT